MNESQRAIVAARLADLPVGRPSTNSATLQSLSQEQAAKLLNISTRSVASAKAVLDKGGEQLIRQVDSGKVSVNAAYKLIAADSERNEKWRIVALVGQNRPSHRSPICPGVAPLAGFDVW
jgi:hypothetical protein